MARAAPILLGAPSALENHSARPGFQTIDLVMLVKLAIETARLWPEQELFVFKLDLRKAFDMLLLSSVLGMLEDSPLPADLVAAIAGELVHNVLQPCLAGVSGPL
eukprot:11104443-Lingulodinium_polyedra.AAC.1